MQACDALHAISFSFMIWVCLTVILILVSASCCCMTSARHRQTTSPPPAGQETIPARRAFQQNALPGNQISNFQGHLIALQTSLQRIDRVRALPTAHQPPLDGDVCGVCLEGEVAGSVWRLLPCGHRFHTCCIDEWLYRPGGACPTCRKDPIVAMDAGVPPLSSLRYDTDNQEDDREGDGRPVVFTPTEEVEIQETRRWTGGLVRDAWGQGDTQLTQTDLRPTEISEYSDNGGSTPADIERRSEVRNQGMWAATSTERISAESTDHLAYPSDGAVQTTSRTNSAEAAA